jgi:hypothetical protein
VIVQNNHIAEQGSPLLMMDLSIKNCGDSRQYKYKGKLINSSKHYFEHFILCANAQCADARLRPLSATYQFQEKSRFRL